MTKKKKKEITISSSAAEYLAFVASTGDSQNSFEMRYEDENIWLTQKMMVTLYDVETHTINYHIKRIFADSELEESSVIRNFRITAVDGKTYYTKHYTLQMIIAVGFKINSERAVQFRKWINKITKDYTIQGWVMDDELLKNSGSVVTEKYYESCLKKSVRYVFLNAGSIKRSRIFTQLLSIMIRTQRQHMSSSPKYRTKCTLAYPNRS